MRWVLLLLAVLLAACDASSPTPAPSATSSVEPTGSTAVLHSATPVPESCQVTKSVRPDDVPTAASEPIRQGSSTGQWTPTMIGNDVLWTTISPDGSLARDDKIVSVAMVDGPLTASARRIDREAVPATISGPNGAHGPNVRGLQVFGIAFSTPGCWEITQQLEGSTLKYVVWVGLERTR